MSRRGRGGDRRSGKQYGPNLVRYSRTCSHCSKVFNAARPDALYCTETCRSAAARERKRERTFAAWQRDQEQQQKADNRAVEKLRRNLAG